MTRAAAADRSVRRCCSRCSSGWWSTPWCWCWWRAFAAPRAGRSTHVREFVEPSDGAARALGQPVDLARERGAGGADRDPARVPLRPLRSPGRPRARRAGRAAGGAPAAGGRGRVSLPLRRDRLRLAAAHAAAAGWRSRRGGSRAPGAILLVHAYSMYVYFYLLVRAALVSLDASQLEAAASLGAGRWRTFRTRGAPAPQARAGGRGAAHLHDRARLVQRAVRLRRRIPGHADADRGHPAQRRRPARDGARPPRSRAWRCWRCWLFRSDPREAIGRSAGRKGAAPGTDRRSGGRSARLLAGVAGWGLADAAAAAAPDAGAGVVRSGRHLDHRAAPAGLHAGQLPRPWCRTPCGCGRC